MGHLLSLVLLGEGLITGIMLTLMLGPVTMIILRNSLHFNRMAGLLAAAGTWVSDFVYIGMTFWMTSALATWTSRPDIRIGLFLAGGVGLLLMGIAMLYKRRSQKDIKDEAPSAGYFTAFAAGFMVNTLSPFTLFFWLGAAVFLRMQQESPVWYYAGVMLALFAGDFTKAWLAPKLTLWLKEQHVQWVQVAAGGLIAATGLYLVYLGVIEG